MVPRRDGLDRLDHEDGLYQINDSSPPPPIDVIEEKALTRSSISTGEAR